MRVTAKIDLEALRHNARVVKQKAPKAQVMAMVKANAYGHGLLISAQALTEVDCFGVASIDEARILRENGIRQPIVLMSGFQAVADLTAALAFDLEFVLYAEYQLRLLECYRGPHKIKVWFKIDTGMHRLGYPVDQAESYLRRLEALPHVEIQVVMSHLACADVKNDPHTLQQLEAFEKCTRNWSYPRSLLNSPGLLAYPDFQYDIVRPGLMLYGASPCADLSAKDIGLKAAMELSASILQLVPVKKGQGVGYGQAWMAMQDSLIATVSIGYGDGYPQYPAHALVLIQNQTCPVVGRVSMDSLAVDVTHLSHVEAGEKVLLWGKRLTVNEVATHANVSVYRLLTGVMERVRRSAA